MQSNRINTLPWRMALGPGLLLFCSHASAVVVTLAVASLDTKDRALSLAGFAGVGVGLAFSITIQFSLWAIGRTLLRLNRSLPVDELHRRWYDPLAGLAGQVNVLIARQAALQELRASLIAQARQAAAQQERNRLARELHDSIKQQIFGISTSAAAAQRRLDGDIQGTQAALGDVRRSAQEAMVEMNALLQQLSPAPLEKVGLVQALVDQSEALSYRSGAQVHTAIGELPADERLPAGAQEDIFRIVQEAFSNIARHARATQVNLSLGVDELGGLLALEISDDGAGFDPGEANGGMGLDNIRQRARALGAELRLESAPGQGTRLRIVIPLATTSVSEMEVQEDIMFWNQDHSLNKSFLVGIGGGLALTAILFYPLYVLLPQNYISGWPDGFRILGFGLEILATVTIVAIGFLAARWARAKTRQGGTLFGALAGGSAGAIVYFSLAAAAAGVAGSRVLLAHGPFPAGGDAQLARLLAEALIGIVWTSHAAFWAAMLAGAGLGAIGGLFAPPAAELAQPEGQAQRSGLHLRGISLLTITSMVSALTFGSAVIVFSLLETSIRGALLENNIPPDSLTIGLPLEGVSFWLIGTPLIFLLTSLLALYFLLRQEVKSADPERVKGIQSTAAICGLLSVAIPVFVRPINPSTLSTGFKLGWVMIGLVLGSLALAGLYVSVLVAVRQRRKQLGLPAEFPLREVALACALLSLALVAWLVSMPPFLVIFVGLVVIAADAILIFFLRRQPKTAFFDKIMLERLRSMTALTIGTGLGTVLTLIVPAMTSICVTTSILTLVITQMPALVNYGPYALSPPPDIDLLSLASDAYLTQGRVCLFVFVAAVALIGLYLLILAGLYSWTRRRVAEI